MNNTSQIPFLESLASRFQLPAWVVDEGQQRLVLFLNHVLMQEKAAQDRLVRQKGRVIHVRWGLFAMDLLVTPAGLVDRAASLAKPDLLLSVATDSPLSIVQAVLAGKAPPVKIEGDVQLAAELAWLAENLRWDVEEDLSRLIGDAPAHGLADAAGRLLTGLKQFLAQVPQFPQPSPLSPDSGSSPERSAGPPQASSAPSGGSAVREATSVGASDGSAGPPQASSAPSGGSAVREATSVGASDGSAGPPQASSARSERSQQTEATKSDAQFSDRPPLGKLAPSGGSEDTPVPNVGAIPPKASE